jgi:anti-sigma regulatory factor (Ser/Thr protein kinase)
MATNTLTVPGNLESLKAVRDFVKHAATEAQLDKQSSYRLVLSVDEIIANIVIHGYDEAGLRGDIEVGFTVSPEHLRIDVFDRAVPYDPNLHRTPDNLDDPLENRPIGGLGVYLARQGTDDFQYEHVDGRNHNTFIVKRPPTTSDD